MRWLARLQMQMRMLFSRGGAGTRLDDELQFHLDRQIAENFAAGMTAEEARYAALRSFGNPALLREQTRATWSWSRLESALQDLRYAIRGLRRSPGFAATVIGTLAVGIGAATAMVTVIDHELLRPLPFRDAARLVVLHEADAAGKGLRDAPWLDIDEWKKRSRSFEDIAFVGALRGRNFLEGKNAAVEISGVTVSPNLFSVLGVQPALGRGFDSQFDNAAQGNSAKSIVLSYALWQTVFAGDVHALGTAARINNETYTVAGVMPRGFFYPQNPAATGQVWIPAELEPKDKTFDESAKNFAAVGRLRRGVSLQSARAEMATIQKTIAPEYTDADVRSVHSGVVLNRYADTLVDADVKKGLLALLAASGVLWLIASVNATNLLLARGAARQREVAMRGALGASRSRVVQQLVIEGLVLSVAAALLGTGLALAGIRIAEMSKPAHLNLDLSAHVNFTILATLCALTILSALVSTAWPALLAVRAPIEPALKNGGPQTGMGRRHNRLSSVLVATEIAMSLALLVVCGLLLRTIYTLRHVSLGFRTDHIVVASLSIPSYRFTGQNITQALYLPLVERVQHLHGVESAGLMSEVPLGQTFNITLSLRGNGKNLSAMLKPVSPEMQSIFGFKMLAGRFFNAQDSPTSEPAAVVNPAFARLYAPDQHDLSSILGLKVWNLRKNAPARVIGVIDNERQKSVAQPSQPEVELCLCQITPEAGIYQPSTVAMDLAVRTQRSTSEMIPELHDLLRQTSPELANAPITTMDQIVEDSYGSQRLAAHLLEIFGGAALVLCIAGLYGLLAFVVARRTRELGVRIALGAQRAALLWLVMRQAGAMLMTGLVAGTILALVSGRLVRGFLYGVSGHDALTLAGAAVILLASGLTAAYLPARRAAMVNPVDALRSE
ncbi:MAG TPA: ABC transporter permease [Terracidiphilus sp.]|nr:ABC transporter permease [Terracidiphilus sp.]